MKALPKLSDSKFSKFKSNELIAGMDKIYGGYYYYVETGKARSCDILTDHTTEQTTTAGDKCDLIHCDFPQPPEGDDYSGFAEELDNGQISFTPF